VISLLTRHTNPDTALVSKLVSNEVCYVPFLLKKLQKQRKTTAKSVVFMARSTEKDITGFFEKSACDKAFSDFFYNFSCSM